MYFTASVRKQWQLQRGVYLQHLPYTQGSQREIAHRARPILILTDPVEIRSILCTATSRAESAFMKDNAITRTLT